MAITLVSIVDPAPGFLGMAPDLPEDLDAAIAARFAADATLPTLATGGLHNGQAGDRDRMPYVVFEVSGGSPAFTSCDSRWLDQRVRFRCFAATREAAGAMARAVVAAYGGAGSGSGVALSYATGLTAPLVLVGNPEATERARGKDSARVCRATVEYSALARVGRPS